MKLRVYRTFKWVPTPGHPVMLGGTNPMSLVPTDELQMKVDGQWAPVPVVEADKPEHPAEARRRQLEVRQAEQMRDLLQNIRVLRPGESPFDHDVRREGDD